ncbi:MAG: hypothetical protein MR643_04805 [Clostridiales bacterium]|nr:hypothetical protein [Clostridiales bacterium]
MDETKQTNDEEQKQKTTAEVMAEMAAEYDAKIAELSAQIEQMKVDHAKELKDILTGSADRKKAEEDEKNAIEEAAAMIAKNLGGKIKE